MSLPEQAGKVATTAIDSLKGSPGLLVLVIMQMITLGALYFISAKNSDHRHQREMAMIERCFSHTEKTAATVPVKGKAPAPPNTP